MSLANLITQLIARAHHWLPADDVIILLKNEGQGKWVYYPDDLPPLKPEIQYLIEHALEENQTTPHRYDSVILAPIIVQDQMRGVFAAISKAAGVFTTQHTFTLQALTEQMGLALQLQGHKDLLQRAKHALEDTQLELKIYHEVAQLTTAGEEWTKILPMMAQQL